MLANTDTRETFLFSQPFVEAILDSGIRLSQEDLDCALYAAYHKRKPDAMSGVIMPVPFDQTYVDKLYSKGADPNCFIVNTRATDSPPTPLLFHMILKLHRGDISDTTAFQHALKSRAHSNTTLIDWTQKECHLIDWIYAYGGSTHKSALETAIWNNEATPLSPEHLFSFLAYRDFDPSWVEMNQARLTKELNPAFIEKIVAKLADPRFPNHDPMEGLKRFLALGKQLKVDMTSSLELQLFRAYVYGDDLLNTFLKEKGITWSKFSTQMLDLFLRDLLKRTITYQKEHTQYPTRGYDKWVKNTYTNYFKLMREHKAPLFTPRALLEAAKQRAETATDVRFGSLLPTLNEFLDAEPNK